MEDTHGSAEWSILKPHAERNALFIVSDELDLLEVARAVAADDTARVSSWLQAGKLSRPSPQQIERWNAAPSRVFESVVVAPFVLAKPSGSASA